MAGRKSRLAAERRLHQPKLADACWVTLDLLSD
jgi:hypothetical protein